MVLELVAAGLLGALVLWLLVGPLVSGDVRRPAVDLTALDDVVPPEETRRGQALIALKELEFDLATGKIAEDDYQSMRERFVGEALVAMREDAADPVGDAAEALVAARAAVAERGAPGANGSGVTCPVCGPRPEADALFCSACGRRVGGDAACAGCGGALPPGVRFCPNCGASAAAAAS